MNKLALETIAIVHSPYKEKFAVPRQPGLVPCATTQLEILPPYNDINAFAGLEEFSHLWLTFIFHKNPEQTHWSPTVRPPRLGGNKRLGVFATRSPRRPNPIGLSVVEYHGIKQVGDKVFLQLGNSDLVDGTPIVDIKPYIPYADAKPNAQAGFAQNTPEPLMEVQFSSMARQTLKRVLPEYPKLQQLIIEVLQQDPRPAYKKNKPDNKTYAVHLSDFNVSWSSDGLLTTVTGIKARNNS